jgi:hypothetical protein
MYWYYTNGGTTFARYFVPHLMRKSAQGFEKMKDPTQGDTYANCGIKEKGDYMV